MPNQSYVSFVLSFSDWVIVAGLFVNISLYISYYLPCIALLLSKVKNLSLLTLSHAIALLVC